ncbi:MAG TPA: hypothetical protein VLF91_05480 [Candidatus Saccharimonadales bacterium]|nr:hypothetical protein [Candidatus Saccharimonadales bacterium]
MRGLRVFKNAALSAVVAMGVILPAVTPALAKADTTCTISPTLVNSCRPWLGSTAKNYQDAPKVAATDGINQVLWQESRMARQDDIVHTYHAAGDNQLSVTDLYFARRAGTMLFTDWNPTTNWADIANQNAAIDSMAASIGSLGNVKIFLTLNHEPENDVSPGGDPNCTSLTYKGSSGTVADYRNLWAYVENRFAADNVHNVVWVMDYMNYPTWNCLVGDLYPGDQYIDWIMFNAYTNTATPNFTGVVDRFHNLLVTDGLANNKPLGIVEWGITGDTVAQEQLYYDQAKAALDSGNYNYLKAYMYFDERDQGSNTGTNYRVGYDDNGTKDTAKGAHYYAFATDPLLTNAHYGPLLDTQPPSTPTGLAANATYTDTISLSWQSAADYGGVTAYNVYRGGVNVATVTSGTSYNDTGLTEGATYTYSVSAVDASGNESALSTSTSIVVPDSTPPSAPADLSATAASSTEVDLSWTASTDNLGMSSYTLSRDGVSLATLPASATTYSDLTTSAQTTYTYTLIASDAAGNPSNPSTATITTPANPDSTPPSAPANLVATAPAVGEIDLSWDAAIDDTGVTGYQIYRDGSLLTTVGGLTSYRDLTVASQTTYAYGVVAVDAAGNASAQSDPATITSLLAPDTTPPSAPASLNAVAINAHEIDVSWSPSSDDTGVTGYTIYRDGQFLASTTGTTYQDVTVNDGTTYSYSVSAFDAANNTSAQSSAFSATTPDATAPSTPTNVSVVLLSPTVAQLSWTASSDNVGVTSYAIYRNGVLYTTVPGAATTYNDNNLSDATTYQYVVVAVDAAGNQSPASGAASITTADATAPSVPTGLSATALNSTAILLSWQPASDNVGVAGYNIFRNGTLLAVVSNGTSYQDSGLLSGLSYQYTVVAFDAAGNASAESLSASATTPDVIAPSAPTGLTAIATSSSQVSLQWQAASDNVGVAGYTIYRNNIALTTVTSTSYVDSGLSDATTYTYSVVAFDASGNTSAASTSVSATTPDVTPPSVPVGLTASAGTNGTTITLHWQPASDNLAVAGYNIYRGGVKIATVNSDASYQDSGLVSGVSYTYSVNAFDAASNQSGLSVGATTTTLDVMAPNAPTGVAATNLSAHQVTISWQLASDNVAVTGYRLYRGGSLIATVTGLSYTDSGLTDATAYTYSVAAFDAAGNQSPLSLAVTATTPDVTPPSVPVGLAASAISSSQINVSWAASSDNLAVAGYKLYRGGALVATISGTSYSDTGLVDSTTYQYTVLAFDAAGNQSAASLAVSATTKDGTPPAKPTNFKGTAVSPTEIDLSWTASTDNVAVTGYHLYRKGVLIATLGLVTSYQDTGVTANTAYTYKLEAFDAASNVSAQATSASITTPAPDTTPPSVPGSFALTPGTRSMKLTWKASTDNVGVAGYRIYRGSTLIATVSASTLTYTDTGLTTGTSYSYHVVAFDAAGNQASTATLSAKAK